eukprot:12932360-Ditylum_brightwellii.AAC.1
MKRETFSFDTDSANGPEVEFIGGIEFEATNDVPSVIMTETDRTVHEKELHKNLEDKYLDSKTSGIGIHDVDDMLLEIMTDHSIPIKDYKMLMHWVEIVTNSNCNASNPMGHHK